MAGGDHVCFRWGFRYGWRNHVSRLVLDKGPALRRPPSPNALGRGRSDIEDHGANRRRGLRLADDFLLAAEDTAGNRRTSTGPTRLLCYHACELYLKAYLRAQGKGLDSLRPYGHDLLALLERAAFHGLQPRSIRRRLTKANETKEYVRVRYMVGEDNFVAPLSQVMRLAKT